MKREGSRKNIYLLGTSSMFNDIGSEMVTPILPYFISSLGGGGAAIGLVSGLREGISSLLKLVGGWLSDRLGKRLGIVFFGYIASALLKLLMAFAQTPAQIAGFISLERIGKMRDPPRDAIIAKTNIPQGKGFGIHQRFDSIGGAVGTILVLLIFWLLHWDFRTIVFAAAGITMLSVIPLFFVKDKNSAPIKRNLLGSIGNLDSGLKKIIYIMAIFSFANFGLYMFLILRAKEISGNEIYPLIIFTIFNLIYAFTSKPSGKLSDHIGRKKVLALGYLLFMILCIGFAVTYDLITMGILFGLYGLVFGLTEPIQKAYVSDLSNGQKGTAMGYFYFIKGLAVIIGGLVAGLIWDIGAVYMFFYLAVVAFVALVALFRTRQTPLHKIFSKEYVTNMIPKKK
jgi:MFS family permease